MSVLSGAARSVGSSYIDPGHFFGELVDAASHERAIAMIVAGEIDGAAIDSTVLERQQVLDPKSVEHLRIVKSLGSNPAPPLVINRSLDPYLRTRLQQAMLAMHFDPADGRPCKQPNYPASRP